MLESNKNWDSFTCCWCGTEIVTDEGVQRTSCTHNPKPTNIPPIYKQLYRGDIYETERRER